MLLSEIKSRVLSAIEDNKDEIIKIGEEILKNPETGYREEKTSALARKVFDSLSLSYKRDLQRALYSSFCHVRTLPEVGNLEEVFHKNPGMLAP